MEFEIRNSSLAKFRDQLKLRVVSQQCRWRVSRGRSVDDIAAQGATVLDRNAAGLFRSLTKHWKFRAQGLVILNFGVSSQGAKRDVSVRYLDPAKLRQIPNVEVIPVWQSPGFEQHHKVGAAG